MFKPNAYSMFYLCKRWDSSLFPGVIVWIQFYSGLAGELNTIPHTLSVMTPVTLFKTLFLLYLYHVSTAVFPKTRVRAAPTNTSSLKFFLVVSRHGSRSPLETFPNDLYPYTDRRFWPNGPKELTNLGKVQLYHTGQFLRERYRDFIDPIYNPDAVKVTYNPYNRDYMSSACLTAGMFPPVQQQIWDPQLKWQPVVQNVRKFDVCDLAFKGTCPKFKKLYNDQIDKFNQDSDKYQDLLSYLSNHTGANCSLLSSTFDIYDTLHMQVENGFKLAQWTKEVFPYKLRPLAITYFSQAYTGSKELISLGAGPELKFLCDMMNSKAKREDNDQKKFYIESAHDCTLISLLKALGYKDPNLEIDTGAYLLFELHYLSPNYIIQVIYFRTTYDEKPIFIKIEGCPTPCSLADFNKFVDSINPPDYKKACIV